jgi:hypothetical protein
VAQGGDDTSEEATMRPPAPERDEPAPLTRCEWCGAEFDTAATRRPDPPPVGPVAPADTPAGEGCCEWCGAEYPAHPAR